MSSNTRKTTLTEDIRAWSTAIIVCFAMMLGLVSTGYGDMIIGNFESPDSNDNWVPGFDGSPVLTPDCPNGVTLGSGSLRVAWSYKFWVLQWGPPSLAVLPHSLTGYMLQFDVTTYPSDFNLAYNGQCWVSIGNKVAINNDNGWQEWLGGNNEVMVTDRDTGVEVNSAVGWSMGSSVVRKRFTLDLSKGNISGISYFQLIISAQLSLPPDTNEHGSGVFYIDNVRLIPPTLNVKKCTVTAGKTQYAGDGDYNDMQDAFSASGTISGLPADLNTITHIDVNIVSADGNSVFFEPNDFNYMRNVKKNKYTHTFKIPKGNPTQGAITSMTIDFNKKTFAVTVKNADLTGLACPLQLIISLGDFVAAGDVGESIVNGPKTTIPTRLMRMYKDTLIVPPGKTKVKSSTKASSDSLSVTGEIAVEDINATDPNLYGEPVVINWSSADDTNDQTFTILPHSFKIPKKGGHLYALNKNITPVVAPVPDSNTKVSGTIDLDKCTFALSITKADLNAVSGQTKFGIQFGDFNEVNDVNLAWKK